MNGYMTNDDGDYIFEAWDPNNEDGPFTEGQICTMVGGYQTLMAKAEAYFWQRYRVDPEWQGHFRYEPSIKITIDYATVEVEGEAAACGRGCCGTDSYTYTFPLSYLWLDQTAILADINVKAEAKAKAEADAKAQREADDKKRQEANERKRLVELAAKYPDAIKP